MKQLLHFSEIILLIIVAGSVLSEQPPKLTLHLNEQIIKTEKVAPSKFGDSESSNDQKVEPPPLIISTKESDEENCNAIAYKNVDSCHHSCNICQKNIDAPQLGNQNNTKIAKINKIKDQIQKLKCDTEMLSMNAKIIELEEALKAKDKMITYLETKCRIEDESQNQKGEGYLHGTAKIVGHYIKTIFL